MSEADAAVLSIDRRNNRLLGAVLTLCFAAPLILAATLTPSDAGMGTHTQMGLPDCGFKVITGYPCATCGCTTSFAHAANGSLLTSFLNQPFGALLALFCAMLALVSAWSAWSGMSMTHVGRFAANKRTILCWLAVLLVAWGYKAAAVAMAPPA
ncbi:MAG: DUF2752 domain-containing protein [Phycisphaeraceae bacterium]